MYLAKNLIDMGMKVKIIEINEERCKLLNEKLPKALIINGDVNLIYTVECPLLFLMYGYVPYFRRI